MDDNAKIYLGTDGAYHDNTPENRELYPAAEDQAESEAGTADESSQTLNAEGGAGAGDGANGEGSSFEAGEDTAGTKRK